VDPAEIPAKLAAIRAAIPAAVSGPVPTKSFIEEQAAGIRNYLAARLRGNN
jgi:hypothetical protein